MNTTKRIIITTILGLVCGVLAVAMSNAVGAALPGETVTRMLLNFSLMGFAIGASAVGWSWAFNGVAFGLAFGVLEGLASLPAGLPVFIPLVYGLIAGVVVEWIARVIFKAGERPKRSSTAS